MAAGHRPCRHRHADGGGTTAGLAGPGPPRHGPRSLPPARLGMEGAVRRHHHPPAPPPRRLARLAARALHHGRGPLRRRARDLRLPPPGRADLPRPAPGELGPEAADGDLRPGGGEPRGARPPVAPALPGGGRAGALPGGRHHPAGNHAGRHGGGGASRGRALRRPGRQAGRAAAGRTLPPRGGGRATPTRKRAAAPSRSPRRTTSTTSRSDAGTASPCRPCSTPRRGSRSPRSRANCARWKAWPIPAFVRGLAGRTREEARKAIVAAPRRARPRGEDRGAHAPGAARRPRRRAAGAAPDRAMVRGRRDPRQAGHRGGGGRPHRVRAQAVGEHLLRLDARHPALVHLPPALVGPPHPRLVRPGRRGLRRARRGGGANGGGGALRPRRRGADAGRGRARHLVLQRPLALQHPRLAGADARAGPLLPRQRARHRVRHHLLLGGPDDDDGPAADGRGALPHRLHPRPGARRARPEDVEVQGQRHGPARADRAVRRRRAALHRLRPHRAGAGPEARAQARGGRPRLPHQAVERRPLLRDERHPPAPGVRPRRRAAAALPLDPRRGQPRRGGGDGARWRITASTNTPAPASASPAAPSATGSWNSPSRR